MLSFLVVYSHYLLIATFPIKQQCGGLVINQTLRIEPLFVKKLTSFRRNFIIVAKSLTPAVK
jgi:hypothetical protein